MVVCAGGGVEGERGPGRTVSPLQRGLHGGQVGDIAREGLHPLHRPAVEPHQLIIRRQHGVDEHRAADAPVQAGDDDARLPAAGGWGGARVAGCQVALDAAQPLHLHSQHQSCTHPGQ